MVGTLVLLLGVSACLLTDCHGFQWQQNLPDEKRIVRCSGEDVTFPWRYSLGNDDELIGVSWILHHGEEKVLGEFVFDNFQSKEERLTQVGNAGIKLTNITPQDTGMYVVSARLNGESEVPSRRAHLVVAKQPQTKNGRLEVMVNDIPSKETTSTQPTAANDDDRLLCGEFTDLGSPPVSVVWEDPDGHILPSTGFEEGYFILDLAEQNKGGNYHCMLNLSSLAFSCLPDDSALREKSMVGVLKRPSPSAADTTKQTTADTTKQTTEAGLGVGAVVGIAIAVLVIIAIVVIVVFVVFRLKRGKSYAPKEPDSPGPDEEAAQPFKV